MAGSPPQEMLLWGGGVPFPSTAPGSTCPFGLVPELGAELALVLQQIMLRHFVPSALPRP